jgi:hypothetical protein
MKILTPVPHSPGPPLTARPPARPVTRAGKMLALRRQSQSAPKATMVRRRSVT